jgi:hypothetical protein
MFKNLSKTLRALALISVARRIGFRRGRKLLLLAATGYADQRRRTHHR